MSPFIDEERSHYQLSYTSKEIKKSNQHENKQQISPSALLAALSSSLPALQLKVVESSLSFSVWSEA